MGHPKYEVTSGEMEFLGEDINSLDVNERAKKGIFMSFQSPEEIPGISVQNFITGSFAGSSLFLFSHTVHKF